jgi:hypothetical protein
MKPKTNIPNVCSSLYFPSQMHSVCGLILESLIHKSVAAFGHCNVICLLNLHFHSAEHHLERKLL